MHLGLSKEAESDLADLCTSGSPRRSSQTLSTYAPLAHNELLEEVRLDLVDLRVLCSH